VCKAAYYEVKLDTTDALVDKLQKIQAGVATIEF
jgi:hypothetical protein